MAARTALTVVGMIGAMVAVYLIISTIVAVLTWVTIFVVPALVIVAVIKLRHRTAVSATSGIRGKTKPAKGIVDCTGESLKIGDTVRAGTGFDGPMELTFGRGVVVKVGHGKAHVRFNDIPEQIHPVTPGALRRLA